jgi:hypothetical protein
MHATIIEVCHLNAIYGMCLNFLFEKLQLYSKWNTLNCGCR